MYDFLKSLILSGGYKLSAMEKTIERHYVRGEITEEEKVELLKLSAEHADESKEIDLVAVIADFDRRLSVLESAGIVVWKSGMSVAKGQTVLYDINKDGVLDRVRYDGGRSATTLSPGKVTGWVVVDANGNPTHRVEKDENGNIIVVPVVAES